MRRQDKNSMKYDIFVPLIFSQQFCSRANISGSDPSINVRLFCPYLHFKISR